MVSAGRLMRAFTLIEMLICVGAVALIAVGLGKLFSSTGATVKIGKQISYFGEVAGSLERQIRRDLAAATRDGPLVIREKRIEDPTNPNAVKGVYLTAERNVLSARVRRADEIMFLSQGKFASNREPMWPGHVPSSSVARVTIGHGMKSTDYSGVNVDTDPANATGLPGSTWPAGLGKAGPNEYASDWILLRHVTVLARPQETLAQMPQAVGGGTLPPYLNTLSKWKDTPAQIKLQPSAPSVFRFDPIHPTDPDRSGWGYEAWTVGSNTPQRKNLNAPTSADLVRTGPAVWPQTASGIVDVASIDPQMIRTRILGVPDRLVWDAGSDGSRSSRMHTMKPGAAFLSTNYTNTQLANFNSAHPMKLLMASMLPGADPWIANAAGVASPISPLGGGTLQEQRMLCAAVPPDFTGNLSPSHLGTGYPIAEPWRQQDQAMLSASNFAVGCSEFIVEWSFGDVYPVLDINNAVAAGKPVGEIIWHGLLRETDATTHALAAAPYRAQNKHTDPVWTSRNSKIGYDLFTERWTRTDPNGARLPVSRQVWSEMIHWPTNYKDQGPSFATDVPLYSFFGYVDPTYNPAIAPYDQTMGDPNTVEWPWPKLLRFTISLVDPADPSVEQTFQFVVDLPAANKRQ